MELGELSCSFCFLLIFRSLGLYSIVFTRFENSVDLTRFLNTSFAFRLLEDFSVFSVASSKLAIKFGKVVVLKTFSSSSISFKSASVTLIRFSSVIEFSTISSKPS